MRIVIAPRARRELGNQLGYLVDAGAVDAARRLERRLTLYIKDTIAEFPGTGKHLEHRNLWESWVPRTKLVLWYRFNEDEVEIVRIWHTSQDRRST